MDFFRWIQCWILLFSFGSLTALSQPPFSPRSKETIGVHTETWRDETRNRPVLVEIWYPTNQTEPIDEALDFWIHPKEVRDAPLAEGKYPLILLSHGHRGDRRDRSWLVEPLVKSGYIVASVEHHGSSWRSYQPLLSLRFWERAKDISFALTKILQDPRLSRRIEPKRIGFVGYSLGGMTGLALSGAKAQNVKEIMQEQQRTLKEIKPELMEQIDFAEAHADFYEPRIQSFVLLAPAAFVFSPESLKKVRAPVAMIASKEDEILPFEEHASKVIEFLGPKKLKLLKTGSHYLFLNRVSDVGKKILNGEIYAESTEAQRMKLHQELSLFIAEFFQETLY